MEQMKKKLFGGYDAEDVDKTITELSNEVAILRQELFTTEKAFSDSDDADTQRLRAEIEELQHEIAVKNRLIENIQTELLNKNKLLLQSSRNADTASNNKILNEQAIKKVFNSYQEAIHARDREIISIKQKAELLLKENSELRKKIAELEKEVDNSKRTPVPDMKIIEKAYTNAFSGARDIANEAKTSISALTDRVFFELNSDIAKTSMLYDSISDAKNGLSLFLEQGMEHFRAIQSIIGSIDKIELNSAEHIRILNKSRDKILADVDKSAGAFDIRIQNTINNATASYAPQDSFLESDNANTSTNTAKSDLPNSKNVIEETTSIIEENTSVHPLVAPEFSAPSDELLSLSFDSFYDDISIEAQEEPAQINIKPPTIDEEIVQISDAQIHVPNIEDDAANILDSNNDESDEDSQTALDEMRNSIKLAISQNGQTNENETSDDTDTNEDNSNKMDSSSESNIGAANENDSEIDGPKLLNKNGAEEEVPEKRPKINIQDILKKYSNIS